MQNQSQKLLLWALGIAVALIGFLQLRVFLLENPSITLIPSTISGVPNLGAIFLTGLLVGGLTCLAVQGGLLASVIASREEADIIEKNKQKHTALPTLAFLATKLIAYILLGFVLGAFGGALNISPSVQNAMQLVAGLYMVAVALNLLNVHPIFRYVIIQPPRFLTRLVRNQSKSKDLFAPAFLGAMTIFIPCGTTIAMETLAISSANALIGATIMGAFILGTIPLFFTIGFGTTLLGDAYRQRFLKLAAIVVIYLGLKSVNGALVASGSPITFPSITIDLNAASERQAGYQANSGNTGGTVTEENGTQVANISVAPNGYTPNYIQVKNNEPVKLNLSSSGGLGCTSVFRIPQLGIVKNVPLNGTAEIAFTPTNPGKINWTCSMGMYSGVIEVL